MFLGLIVDGIHLDSKSSEDFKNES